MSSMQCIEGYLAIFNFNICSDKNGLLRKKRCRFDKMNVDRNIKEPDMILSNLLISKADIGLKRFFRKIGTLFNLCDFENGGCLTFLVAARQP